jgi:integrase
MSVKFKQSRGKYEVRWREGGRAHSRLFARKGDADAFDLDIRRRQQLGPLAGSVLQSRVTLAGFVLEEWWPRYALPNLAEDTLRRYLEVWGAQIEPRLGAYELRLITPGVVEDFRSGLERAGVGAPTVRKAMMILQGVFKRAVARGLVPVNPVKLVDKPRQKPTLTPSPLSPATIERIRAYMLEPRTRLVPASGRGQRSRRAYEAPVGSELERHRNALIVSMLAYAGLRPIEDRGSQWEDLHERRLHVFASKTNRERNIDLLSPLAQDLAEWRLMCGRPDDGKLIVPRPTGGDWTRGDWGNWRNRVWRPAAIACGVTGDMRPYRLRGSFVSLLLWSGKDLAYVAEQAGHSIATLAKHYAGVIKDLQDQPRVDADEAIRAAREQVAADGLLLRSGAVRP